MNFERLERLFHEYRALPADERERFLEEECREEPELIERIRAMAAHAEESGITEIGPLVERLTERHDPDATIPSDPRTAPSHPGAAGDSPRPDAIGGYVIKGKLGEGGMGVVYEAEQQNPKRSVALKVVRGGRFVDKLSVKMFQREIETLGRLKHPNIGAIYESGVTDEGQHYFAMELVRGRTLDAYLAAESVPVEERVDLVRTLCGAVHYAHQRGVIHRDLKPSNIVVGDSGEVKILDFGLARITDSDTEAVSVVSETGAIKGTLPYMSPEQARGNPNEIDLRTDVYSLGVILYQVLANRLPYDTDTDSILEAVRVIVEQAPARFDRAAGLGDELETITRKSLEKEPDLRYQSAAAFADDLERYRTNQPILARPPSTIYQLKKLVARNKLPFALAASLFVALIGFGVWMSLLYRESEANLARALDAEQAAAQEAETANRVSQFMIDLFQVSDPGEARGNTITAREILDKGAAEIEEGLGDEPAIQATLLGTMGDVYQVLGLYSEAERLNRSSIDKHESLEEIDHEQLADRLTKLGQVLTTQGRYDESNEMMLRMIAELEKAPGDNEMTILGARNNLAIAYKEQGRYEEAAAINRELLVALERIGGDGVKMPIAVTLNNLAGNLEKIGNKDEAGPLYEQSIAMHREVLGNDHHRTAQILNNYAIWCDDKGRYDEAEQYYKEALAINEKSLGPSHRNIALCLNNLGGFYVAQGRLEEAEPMIHEGRAMYVETLGADHWYVGESEERLARLRRAQGRYDEAIEHYRNAIAICDQSLGPDARWAAGHWKKLGDLHRDNTKDYAAAENAYRRADAIHTKHDSHDDKNGMYLSLSWGRLCMLRGESARAESLLVRGLDLADHLLGGDRRPVRKDLESYATLLRESGRAEEAAAIEAEVAALEG